MFRVIVEHARGTPRGEDLRRDLDRGIVPGRRSERHTAGQAVRRGGGRDR